MNNSKLTASPAIFIVLPIILAACLMQGCLTVDSLSRAFSMAETHASNLSRATDEFTPEQEYYLGRAVAARIIQKYSPLKDGAANKYLNLVGQSLVLASRQPNTYGGYHFMLLDSGEVNAFAAPGGFIFVTRGMVGLVSNESELAAVLAHEIAHVRNKDAVKAIKASRMSEALLLLGKDAAGRYTGGLPGGQLLALFSGSVDDIVNTLVSSGYSRSQEYAADAAAGQILASVGYSPQALGALLRTMEKRVPSGSSGFGGTHPSAAKRLDELKTAAASTETYQEDEARVRRFNGALGKYGASGR